MTVRSKKLKFLWRIFCKRRAMGPKTRKFRPTEIAYFCGRLFLKKNQNTPRPSEHPPVMGEKMSKRLGGIKGCKYKTSYGI